MADYEKFKNWNPKQGDYINKEQKEASRESKRKARRNKMLMLIVGGIIIIGYILMKVLR